MEKDIIEQLELFWDFDKGFLGQLRDGKFNRSSFNDFISFLRSISFEEEEYISTRIVSLLWYIPLFMQWQTERVTKEISIEEYNNVRTEIENELEKILGIP